MKRVVCSKPINPTRRVNRVGGVSSGRSWAGVSINCGADVIRAIPSMRSANYSTDAPRASEAAQEPASRQRGRRLDLLRGLAPIVGRAGAVRIVAHVLLSLVAALMGSIADIVLVPLIQRGHAPVLGGHVLALPTSPGTLTLIFAGLIGGHVLLRWLVSGL